MIDAAPRAHAGPRLAAALALLLAAASTGCKGEPDDTPWCSAGQPAPEGTDRPVSYYADVKPIVDAKCARCHQAGGIAPFPLSTYAELAGNAAGVRDSIATRHMPPWQAARCCNRYFHDVSLTDGELATFLGWLDNGVPPGDPSEEGPPEKPVSPLSRVDATLRMTEPYTPRPRDGTTDDTRCFVVDWPFDHTLYVTGLEPKPGTRSIVHHLIVAAIAPDSVDDVVARDADDSGPGFDCSDGVAGIDWRDVKVLGGSLGGGDFPRGIGARVEAGSKVVLDVHYSTVEGVAADLTEVDVRVDERATEALGIALANPAWLAGEAMSIPAGEKDAVFFYRLEPDLFTWDRRIKIQSITPHMHAFGTKMVVRAMHDEGEPTCLLEIPDWHFGWEQPFWLEEPLAFGDDEELYIECHFDNSAANQPDGKPPRDIAWGGNNQDMCAAFLGFSVDE